MAKLIPLLHEGTNEVEQRLLEAAREDGPPDDAARAKTLAALRTMAAAGATGGAASAVGWKLWQAWASATGKWIAIGAIAVSTVTTGAVFVGRKLHGNNHPEGRVVAHTVTPPAFPSGVSPDTANLAPKVIASSLSDQPLAASPPTTSVHSTGSAVQSSAPPLGKRVDRGWPERAVVTHQESSGTSPSAESAQGAAPPPGAQAPAAETASTAPSAAAPITSVSTSLREETGLLEAVRASLARSNPTNALAALATYNARFPSGMLADEASVLRVEALMSAGRRGEARESADRFMATHPESPYANRMRVLFQR